MKYVDLKKGMRVVVTHHNSHMKGTEGTVSSMYRMDGRGYARVKLANGYRDFAVGSISPAPVAKADDKLSENEAKPLTVDDIVVGTELIYNGAMRGSGRAKGDVYVVYRKYTDGGITYIHYKYKSGKKPDGFEQRGVLRAGEILKFWEIAL